MKFIIKKTILLNHLNYVSRAISTKNIIPVLSGIKFDLTKKGLFLEASDENIIINTLLPKDKIESILEEGKIIIPGKYILEIIRKIPNELINFETDGQKILITTESSEYTLNGMNYEDFPTYNFEFNKEPILINSKTIESIVNQVAFSTSLQESRPILTGINFKLEKDKLEVVATDSYRLSLKTFKLENKGKETYDFVLPKTSLLELVKIIDSKKEIETHIFNNKIIFKFDNILFQSKLLVGTFPNINSLIPKEISIEIKANLDNLYNLIDRTSLLSDSEKNIIQLEINTNELIATCETVQIGKVEERLLIENKSNKNLKISFNAKYMLEALKSFENKNIIIKFVSEIKQFIIQEENNEELIQLIVPVRTY